MQAKYNKKFIGLLLLNYITKFTICLIFILLFNNNMIFCQQNNKNEKVNNIQNNVDNEINLLKNEINELKKNNNNLESEKEIIRKENNDNLSQMFKKEQDNSFAQLIITIISIFVTALLAYIINNSKIIEDRKSNHLLKIKEYLKNVMSDEEFFGNPLYEDLNNHFKTLYESMNRYKNVWKSNNDLIIESIRELSTSFKNQAPFEVQIIESNIFPLLRNPKSPIFDSLRYDKQDGIIRENSLFYIRFLTGEPTKFIVLANNFINEMKMWRKSKKAEKIESYGLQSFLLRDHINRVRDEVDKYEHLSGNCKFIVGMNIIEKILHPIKK